MGRRPGIMKLLPECKHGHPRTKENTYYKRNGSPVCRICAKHAVQRFYTKTKDFNALQEKYQRLLRTNKKLRLRLKDK